MKRYLLLATAMAAACCATSASAQNIDLAAVDASRSDYSALPVTQSFGPGSYLVQVVGRAGGGLYDAWGVATPSQGNWDERYSISYNGTTTQVNPLEAKRFATEGDALNAFAGILTSFTLAAQTDVTFSIPDNWWFDNVGGVSLKVSPADGTPAPVPEPGTMALFGLAAGALLWMMGKRRVAGSTLA